MNQNSLSGFLGSIHKIESERKNKRQESQKRVKVDVPTKLQKKEIETKRNKKNQNTLCITNSVLALVLAEVLEE